MPGGLGCNEWDSLLRSKDLDEEALEVEDTVAAYIDNDGNV